MIEADFVVDAVLGGGLADVVQDSRPVGDRLRLDPWLERIAHRNHVAVGADARITEQVPGAADAVATLENDKTLGRTTALQMITRADAGPPGADDQHIDMFVCGRFHRLISPQIGRKSTGKRSDSRTYRDQLCFRVSSFEARRRGSHPRMTVPMLPSPCGGRSSRPSKGDGTRTSFSIPVMLRLERAFRLDADIFGLIRSQLCQLDADLGEMQPCHFFIERLREHVDLLIVAAATGVGEQLDMSPCLV